MDAVSYALSAKQKERIERVIANPDSNSGIVTVPKVIGAGESVTIPAGRMAVLPNVQVDGTLNIEGEVFVPSGSAIDMGNGLAINGEKVVMSVPTSYHLLQGNLAVDNTVITQGFNTTLYTGNGSTQSINTGIDMDTQWGSTTEERFGGLVWVKSRSIGTDHGLFDTIRGATQWIASSTTSAQSTQPTYMTAFDSIGFSVGSGGFNSSAATYTSWNFQTTHRISGVTNHGKPYTCHYNPYTGFTIVKYEGSGIAGHEIPHYLGRKIFLTTTKNLSVVSDWTTDISNITGVIANQLTLNTLNAQAIGTSIFPTYPGDNFTTVGTHIATNNLANQYIMYGWANSYKDEANTLIGNYEVGVYQGTGAAGNKVTTRAKPAWVMIKRLDSTGGWHIWDNQRPLSKLLYANTSSAETTFSNGTFDIDGFTITHSLTDTNASGGQYLYMVAYDTNSNGGGSYYPKSTDTANVQINNALIPIAKGSDINGLKNVMLSKNESITGLTYTARKNYIYYDGNGNKGVKAIAPNYGTTNPSNGGDFYNVLENKWYTSADVEIPEGRNYLNHIVHADNDGGVLYVEELPKIEYKDVIKANEYQGKNACTAWVNFDGTTTPPTIRDSYNVSSVVRTYTAGRYDIYFEIPMNNKSYSISGFTEVSNIRFSFITADKSLKDVNKFSVICTQDDGVPANSADISIQIFGGKN